MKRSSELPSESIDNKKPKISEIKDNHILNTSIECKENIDASDAAKTRIKINKTVAEMKLKLSSSVKTLIKHLDSEWCYQLSSVIQNESFEKLAKFVENERSKATVYPPQEDVSYICIHFICISQGFLME